MSVKFKVNLGTNVGTLEAGNEEWGGGRNEGGEWAVVVDPKK